MSRARAAGMSVLIALALCLSTGVASGYYHFVHYTASEGAYQAAPEKFDLAALPNQTLFYFVSPKGPESLAPGDSYTAMLSQIRMAAKVWSAVETSALRFEFGGLSAPDTAQATPGVDVLFGEVELPPGLIALGGPISRSTLVSNGTGSFIPITRSILVLGKDLSQRPSHTDAFFLTVVHELGHALGLQHTFTSSVMSTEVTRSTTRAKPLAADDVAGISSLYPAQGFSRSTGSISGRVTLGGRGVHLASVVALEPAGTGVSTLTDPDGYYRIVGLTPGQYYLYAHPLPPGGQSGLGPADIVLPVDGAGNQVPAGPLFETAFHPGTKTISEATVITVHAGEVFEAFDLAVNGRGPLELYGVTTYSFPGNYAVKPAFVNVNGSRRFLVAAGKGLIANSAPSPGLRAKVVGGSATVLEDGVKAYPTAPSYLQLDFSFSPFGGEGPRHLIFSSNNDLYVLPAAFHLVRSKPPSIASVTPGVDDQGNAIAVVSGSNLVKSTRILFDGLPAVITAQDETNGNLTVIPPVGSSGHRAVVTAVDLDGQDSLFLDGSALRTYTYGERGVPSVTVTPPALPAGTEAMVEITGLNTAFSAGQTIAGFGSSDVSVRRAWVTGPGRLLANVRTSAGAQAAAVPLTVVTGFQTATQGAALQIQPAAPWIPAVNPEIVNPSTGQQSVYAGGQASARVTGLPAGLTPAGVNLTLDGLTAEVLAVEEDRVLFGVPAVLGVGPAVLRMAARGIECPPVVVAIDPAPPVILGVSTRGVALGPDWPGRVGGDLYLTVAGLAEPGVIAEPSRVKIALGGVLHTPLSVSPVASKSDTYVMRFTVGAGVETGSAVPLTVALGYRVSERVLIAVEPAL
ncbi:MAG TPA: matrixin family metalloprotease [Bryobacteraceae bacterium]|nr:matrixin family metalloprotease [Bryobacteraceae bacterium]